MPSRKQRRRREKTFRHEYGFITYDEEGNEIEVDPTELRPEKPEKRKPEAAKGRSSGRSSRATREPPVPSWRRSIRRGGLWGGMMFVVVVFFFRSTPLAGRVVIAVFYAVAFIPLTYFIDRIAYRSWEKRTNAKR